MLGQFMSSTQFYLYGRNNFTRTGHEKSKKSYEKPDLLEDPNLDLSGKVYIVTGANTGVGREIATFLAIKRATVYMVCRNPERANTAKEEIVKLSDNKNVFVVIGDCSLESDIRRIWNEFSSHQASLTVSKSLPSSASSSSSEECKPPSLSGLICNAGALLNTR